VTLNSSPGDGITDDAIKVGWIGDLTGPTASAQAFNAHGSQAYFECSNADGGLFGRMWEFFAEDDGYNAEKSAIALTKLIEDEEVIALVDLGGSGQAAQAIPELEATGVPVIGPPQTVDPTLGSGQFFHNIVAYGDQADIFVGEAANRLGDASNAVVMGIVLEVPSGTEYASYVQDSVIAAGGTYVGTEYVGLRVQEATAQILKLQSAIDQYGVNMVALHGAPYHNELVLKAMSAAGITDIPVVGIHGVASNSIFENSPEDVTDDTYGVHSFKTSSSDIEAAAMMTRCANLAGYPGEDLVNNFAHGFVNSYILHQAIEKAAAANNGDVTRASLTKALQGKFDTMGISCDIDWTTSNHSPCGAPFTMDRATGGMVPAGEFSEYAEFLDGVYGIDPVTFEVEIAINSSPDDGITDDAIKVGWIGDLTGPTASAQAFNAHGSQAYFECSNADGGLGGRMWEFFAEDDGYNAEKSAIALTKLIEDEEVIALVDLGGSGQAAQAIPELEAANVAVIGPPQTIDPTLGSGQFFHNIAAYGDQADIFVGVATKRFGDASNAVVLGIVLEVPSGTEYATYVQDSVTAAGGTYVGTEYVGLRVQEATAQILKLQKAIDQYGVNMVALHGAPYHNELVLKAMSAAGITEIPVVGIHGVASNSIYENSPEDVTDDTYGVHSFKTSNSDAAGASELKRCADLAGYPGEDLVNNFSHGFVNSYILHQAIVKAAEQNSGNVTRATLTKALQGKFDTMGLSCNIDWTTSNHNPCGAPFTMDRATGGMVPDGEFSEYAEFLDGVYGIDPVVFEYELAIGDPERSLARFCDSPSFGSMAEKLTRDLGLLEAHGITMEAVQCSSGPANAAALIADEVDFVNNTPDNMLGIRNAGFDVVMFAQSIDYHFFDIVVSTGGAVPTMDCDQGDWECAMAALNGTTVGVVARGAAAEQIARQLLDSAGFDPEDTTYVATGLAAGSIAAMASGEVDWCICFEPGLSTPTLTGVAYSPFSLRAGDGPDALKWPSLVRTTSRVLTQEAPNFVRHYSAATSEAAEWMRNNRDETIDKIAEYLSGGDADLAAAIYDNNIASLTKTGVIDRAGIENNIAYALGRGIIAETMSFDDVAVNLED
jgi:ABC-type branched-subunit amino acid transport system substrate-binding protein/ABC-type nitrate/sulfonate/bicarbonate transport system substrate-binding protein